MKIEDFDYHLPEELIAQKPAEKRDASRLLVVHRDTGKTEHRHFYDILEYLQPGDCLVLNNSKVLPARLFGTKEKTGAKVEFSADQADRGRYLGNYGQAGETVETRGQRDLFGEAFAAGRGEGLRQ